MNFPRYLPFALPHLLLATLASILSYCPSARAELQTWTTAQTTRLLRDAPAPDHPSTAPVHISLARNEWRSFQIFVRDDAGQKALTLEPGDLIGPSGAILPGRDAVLYREQQIELATPSERNDHFQRGWYPDPLIPFRDPITGRPLPASRFTAVPFDLPPKQTHGFLIDLYAPSNAAPGDYQGLYTLSSAAGQSRKIPVTLTIWDFQLPQTPTLQTCFGAPMERLKAYYKKQGTAGAEKPPADWNSVERQVSTLLSDHRINASPSPEMTWPISQPDGSYRIPDAQLKALGEFIDRYHVNVIVIPKPDQFVDDPITQNAKLRAWLKCFDDAAARLRKPGITFLIYLTDEPNDLNAYRYVQKWGKAIRDAHSIVKVMVTEQTKPQNPAWGDLYGAIDIWVPLFPLFDSAYASKRQALGETIWTYTALTQEKPTPWWEIDFPLLNYRIPTWIAWRYRMRGLLYWGSLCYWDKVQDPWTDPKTYGEPEKAPTEFWNGEGSLTYPARAVGYDGLVLSLRLKAIRDSVEDYEYLAMLERAGKAAEAEKIVLPLADSWFKWDPDESHCEEARLKLAQLILSRSHDHPQPSQPPG